MCKLHVLNGPEMGKIFKLNDALTYVGRSDENDILIDNMTVSRRHLKVVQRDNRFFVTDLESENGTYIGGDRVTQGLEVEVEEGRPITIGMCMICLGEAPPEQAVSFMKTIGFAEDPLKNNDSLAVSRSNANQKNLEFLSRVSKVIKDNLPLKVNLEKILEYILNLLKRVDRVAFILLDPETENILEVVSRSRKQTTDAYCTDVVKQVLEYRMPVVFSNVRTEKDSGLVDTLRILNIQSVMCFPMLFRSQPIGLIYVDSLERPHGFRKEDLSLFTDLSKIMAHTLQKARFSSKSTIGADNIHLGI